MRKLIFAKRRLEQGFSQEKVSLLMKKARTHVQILERPKKNPTWKTICGYAKAIQVEPWMLIEGAPNGEPLATTKKKVRKRG